jgi:hypothetical protein
MKKVLLYSVVGAFALYLILGLVSFGEAAGKPKPPPATPANPMIVYVAVSSSGPYNELAVANADGSNQTALLSSDQVGYFFPAWSPDLDPDTPGFQGSVVFELWAGAVEAPSIDLWLIDVVVSPSGITASNARLLSQSASGAAWSPNGDKIAYVSHASDSSQRGIRILDLNSGADTLLIADPSPEDNTQNVNWPAWNPSGTHLAYSLNDGISEEQVRKRELIDENGAFVLNGDDSLIVSDAFGARGLDWSRGSRFLAFKAAGAMQIVDLNSFTPQMQPLLDSTWTESPTWMPTNESELVFMNRNGRSGAGKRKIVKRNLVTNAETVIVERNGFHLYEPDWRR